MAFSSRNLIGLARTALRAARHLAPGPARTPPPARQPGGKVTDYTGSAVKPAYAPNPDGAPDPGEVVWAWVPYEDDPSQGKDRPVLLIGRSGSRLLGLMLTTRDRNNSAGTDPDYLDIGTGAWDSKRRPSEVKLDRVLALEPSAVRRQGAVVDRAVFERVARHLAQRHPR